jgi:inner membrane protein
MHEPSLASEQPGLPSPSSEGPQNDAPVSVPKILLIATLAFATLIPTFFVWTLIAERENRQGAVQSEFTRNWGPPQELHSPILVVPYQSAQDRPREYLKVTPDRLDVTATLNPQERKRGLFRATVYDARVEMQGVFVIPSEPRLKGLMPPDGRLLWNESFIAFTTTSLIGLKPDDKVSIDGVDAPWQPCAEAAGVERDCKGMPLILAAAPVMAGASSMSFQLTVSLRGTASFNLSFAGKELDAAIRSPWTTPSFGGSILPENSSVTSHGFEAHWQTTSFGSAPISTAGGIVDPASLKGATIGVELIEATPLYRTISRVAKYGLLFVLLSFAVYFFFELLSRLRIHLVQYALLGLSISLFSLLLLSLSEPIGYPAGYIASASLILVQSSLYTAAVARRVLPALVFAVAQACLFAFIYILIDLETYSLLIGALALFAVVSALMVLTQRVNRSAQPLVFFK